MSQTASLSVLMIKKQASLLHLKYDLKLQIESIDHKYLNKLSVVFIEEEFRVQERILEGESKLTFS